MSEAVQLSRLAVKLLTDLSTSEAGHTSDEPLEMVQLSMVLKAFGEVSDIAEDRVRSEVKRSGNQSQHSDHTPEDAGTIG